MAQDNPYAEFGGASVPSSTAGSDPYAEFGGQSAPASNTTPPAPHGGLMENIVGGFLQEAAEAAKGIFKPVVDATEAISGEKPPTQTHPYTTDVPSVDWAHPGTGIQHHTVTVDPSVKGVGDQTSIGHTIGSGVEQVGEFALGGEAIEALKELDALKGVAKAAKLTQLVQKYPLVGRMLALSKEYPLIGKLMGEVPKAAAIGAVQGGVHGEAEGSATKGAEGGAMGGAVGAGVGETAGAILKELAPMVGIG